MNDITSTLLMFALMGAALYFLMIRPQQKRAKEQQNLLSSLEVGSRVMTASGILGTIKYVGDKQIILEIAPGVEMTVVKAAISTQRVEDEFEYDDAEPESVPVEPVQIDDPEDFKRPADPAQN